MKKDVELILYVNGVSTPRMLPILRWGSSGQRARLDAGYHSKEERDLTKQDEVVALERLSKRECLATPVEFRDLLLSIARA